MVNFSQDVLKSELWVIDAQSSDDWYSYFDWLTQFELTRKKHLSWGEEKGYSLLIDKKSLLAERLLIVDFDRISPAKFLEIWQSLGSPLTTLFNAKKDLSSYLVDSRYFNLVSDIE
jgi:hypothetical protein